ncbi:MAG: agmatinase [Eubacteriales bacterium]|nr:agmatinase [Eubacteriales bacterium]
MDLENRPSIPRFCGFTHEYEAAEWVIFGAPFDGTTSFRPGTRFAPERMRVESWGLESYSPYQDRDLEEILVHDAGDLELPFGNPERALELIEDYTKELLQDAKHPVMIGGEHLLTLATVRAVHERYPDLELLHLDAHTDLRKQYLGERLSHANVIRLIAEFIEPAKIHSFGIRSGLKEEFDFARQNMDFNPFSIRGMGEKLKALKESAAPVYLTLDLDVLDPSVFPGTGTPEPGGPDFRELLTELLSLRGLNLVGFDLMELSPPWDESGISTAAAAKLLRELLLIATAP